MSRPPFWRQAYDRVERAVAPWLEAGVRVDKFASALLSVLAERDHISPALSVGPVVDLVGSADVEEIRLPVGHVGLMASRTASKWTIPRIVDWIHRHSLELS